MYILILCYLHKRSALTMDNVGHTVPIAWRTVNGTSAEAYEGHSTTYTSQGGVIVK